MPGVLYAPHVERALGLPDCQATKRYLDLPEKVRHDAKFLLRHYPTLNDVILAGKIEAQAENMPIGAVGPVVSSTAT